MDRNKQKTIDDYLLGELNGEELREFKLELKKNPEMAREVQFQQEVLESIRDEKKFALRDTLNEVGTSLNRKYIIRRYSKAVQLAAAVIVIAILVGGSFLFQSIFNTTDSSQQLYEEYFAPEYDLMTVRSITSNNSTLHQGMNNFANREYYDAILAFENVPDNMLGKLYSGFSYMHIENYDLAEAQFKNIIEDGDNMFTDQAAWHLGLCYLASNKQDEAKIIFVKIANGNTFYKSKALELLTRMGSN